MHDDLGEFVGKGFALLRDRLKAVEARKAINGIDGQDGTNGADGTEGADGSDGKNGINGLDGGNGLDGDNGTDGRDGSNGADGDDGADGKDGQDGIDGQDGTDGTNGINGQDGLDGKDATATDGADGVGVDNTSVDKRGHLIVTLTDGRTIDAGKLPKGKDGSQFHGMIAGGPSTARPSGIATLDFADDSNIATVDITGLSGITSTSVVMLQMRIEATADNSLNDLLIDPIRVAVSAYTVGVGFTIHGTMEHGPAQGLYLVNWTLA